MTAPLVFVSSVDSTRPRIFWLEDGRLWTWSRVSWRWWAVPTPEARSISGVVVQGDDLLELIAERGSPNRPRVDAGGWLPCLLCGREGGADRVWLGTRGPFCCREHRDQWAALQPAIDCRSTR